MRERRAVYSHEHSGLTLDRCKFTHLKQHLNASAMSLAWAVVLYSRVLTDKIRIKHVAEDLPATVAEEF